MKYQLLIKKRGSAGLKHLIYCKAFIECSNDMDVIHKNTEEYNPNKTCKYWSYLMKWFQICLEIKNLIQ